MSAQFGVGFDSQPAHNDALEVLDEIVGEVERGWVVVMHCGETRPTGEELVAMGAGHHLDRGAGFPILVTDVDEFALRCRNRRTRAGSVRICLRSASDAGGQLCRCSLVGL